MAKTKNDFDCVQMKREIQARVAAETKGMTAEQRDAYIRERADAFAQKMGWIYESVPDEHGHYHVRRIDDKGGKPG